MIGLAWDALRAVATLAARHLLPDLPHLSPVTISVHIGDMHTTSTVHPPPPQLPPPAVADAEGNLVESVEPVTAEQPASPADADDWRTDPDWHLSGDRAEDCPCRPTSVPVERPDGVIGWVLAHHRNLDPTNEAARSAAIFEGMEEVRRHRFDEE